jgi:hypothetical protein
MSGKLWYTVQVTYKCGAETKLFRITNLDSQHLKNLRENMFTGGLYRKIDPDTGEVISPWNIIETMIFRQEYFFNADLQTAVEEKNTSIKKSA